MKHRILWTLAEFFRLSMSLAEGLECEALWVGVARHNVEGRPLSAFDPRYRLWAGDGSRKRDVVQSRIIPTTDLASAWHDLSLD